MKHSITMPTCSWRTAITVTGFIGWSAAMIVVGSISPDFGFSQSQAAAANPVVRLDRDRLSGNNLGEFSPYEPEAGNLIARGHQYFNSDDGGLGIGVWESKAGEMTYADIGYDELMVVLDGEIVLTDENGHTESYGPGEGLILTKGWSGTFAVSEGGVRKIWVAYMGVKK